jgi:hypothetical protein
VEAGGEAVFVAKAKYTQNYLWQLVSPDGIIYDCDSAHLSFPGLKVTGADTERVTLSNIPIELDGYRVRCMFTAGDAVTSNMAKLTVTEKPTEPPTEPLTEPPTEATKATEGKSGEKNSDNKSKNDKNSKNEQTNPSQATNPQIPEEPENNSGSNTLLIVLIICVAAVAIAGIAGFTIVKLKAPGRR